MTKTFPTDPTIRDANIRVALDLQIQGLSLVSSANEALDSKLGVLIQGSTVLSGLAGFIVSQMGGEGLASALQGPLKTALIAYALMVVAAIVGWWPYGRVIPGGTSEERVNRYLFASSTATPLMLSLAAQVTSKDSALRMNRIKGSAVIFGASMLLIQIGAFLMLALNLLG